VIGEAHAIVSHGGRVKTVHEVILVTRGYMGE